MIRSTVTAVTNPNIFVFGKPRCGQSAWVKAFLDRMFAFGYQPLILGVIRETSTS